MRFQEIGLSSLNVIGRGAVRVEKNPVLCFVESIDWSLIARNSAVKNLFAFNKPQNECPLCPSGKRLETSGEVKDSSESLECPPSKHDPKSRLCWNRHNCQRSESRQRRPVAHS